MITTSWDDGHPEDLRLAELLKSYDISGTFYIPRRNRESRDVMTGGQIRSLSSAFEVGGHTIDHLALTVVDPHTAGTQIHGCKEWLEDLTSRPINGFCYPRGQYNEQIKQMTRIAGFKYARTVKNLFDHPGRDPFALSTTVQFAPTSGAVYLRNYLKSRMHAFIDREAGLPNIRLLSAALTIRRLVDRVRHLADLCERSGGVFHLWGHSWEITQYGLWDDLRESLKHLAGYGTDVQFGSNLDVVSSRSRDLPDRSQC
ncbi:MAG TPA: polysaccharide deacetylase family protein [Xanthobacteraceae bacterium]